jgi:hypothetical protein
MQVRKGVMLHSSRHAPSLLTCTTQAPLIFPMRVVVQLDGAVVNDFTAHGLGVSETIDAVHPGSLRREQVYAKGIEL